MKINYYKPAKGTLSFSIVRRILDITIGKLQIAFYWYYKNV